MEALSVYKNVGHSLRRKSFGLILVRKCKGIVAVKADQGNDSAKQQEKQRVDSRRQVSIGQFNSTVSSGRVCKHTANDRGSSSKSKETWVRGCFLGPTCPVLSVLWLKLLKPPSKHVAHCFQRNCSSVLCHRCTPKSTYLGSARWYNL